MQIKVVIELQKLAGTRLDREKKETKDYAMRDRNARPRE
jgi:hypothetical protein